MYNIYQKYKSIIIILVKLIIVGAAFYFISKKIVQTGGIYQNQIFQQVEFSFVKTFWVVITVLAFTFANWYFEILKWKTLVRSVKYITFLEAFKQSTSSLTASLLTPNRIGEYGAKAIYYTVFQRKKIMFLNLIGNVSQMLITIIFGFIGMISLYSYFNFTMDLPYLNSYFFIGLFVLGAWFLFRYREYIRGRIIAKIIHYLKEIPVKDLKKSMQFSLFRYIIFSHQFYFLLMVFGIDMDYFTAMGAVFSMYFIASILPGFVVFDFIVKGSVAMSVFGLFGVPDMLVLAVTTMMWLLNFALPAIIGSYYVFSFEMPEPAKVVIK